MGQSLQIFAATVDFYEYDSFGNDYRLGLDIFCNFCLERHTAPWPEPIEKHIRRLRTAMLWTISVDELILEGIEEGTIEEKELERVCHTGHHLELVRLHPDVPWLPLSEILTALQAVKAYCSDDAEGSRRLREVATKRRRRFLSKEEKAKPLGPWDYAEDLRRAQEELDDIESALNQACDAGRDLVVFYCG